MHCPMPVLRPSKRAHSIPRLRRRFGEPLQSRTTSKDDLSPTRSSVQATA